MDDSIDQPWDSTQALLFISEQESFHEKRAVPKPGQSDQGSYRNRIHARTAAKFRQLGNFVADLIQSSQTKSPPKPTQLALTFDDVQDLPQELLAELSISSSDWTEFEILNLINESGGILSLDKILIGLYRKNGEIHKRTNMNNRLYRMTGKGILFNVPNRKGVYSTVELSPEEAELALPPKTSSSGNAEDLV